jgi:DNA-binding response OmpR family regulator
MSSHTIQSETQKLTLDPVNQCVRVRDREVPVTKREFDVLHYLMRHSSRLVSDTELLEVVWGSNDVIGTTALRSVIKRLRRKIEDDPKQPRYIMTIWGRGYRFRE